MTRRFTVIQGGLRNDAPGRVGKAGSVAPPADQLSADAIVGAPSGPRPADHGVVSPFRPSGPSSIPPLAFVGIRPAASASASGRGDGTAP